MKIRLTRGSLQAAMSTVAEIAPTAEAVRAYLIEADYPGACAGVIAVSKYGSGIDQRIGWDTHAVTVDGYMAAFTDGPIA